MEITQAKPVPQTASTGSTGASVAGAFGSEAGNDGFLSLMNSFFMGEGDAEDTAASEAPPAGGQGTQAASAIPDGILSLMAPGLFSNMLVQPQQPASGDTAAGDLEETAMAGPAPAPAAGPAPALTGGAPLQAPEGPPPGQSAKGPAPAPGSGGPAAGGEDAGIPTDAMNSDADAQISEEDLAKLVAEGKAKVEARQDAKASQRAAQAEQSRTREHAAATGTDAPAPLTATVQTTAGQTATGQAGAGQTASVQAAPAQAAPAQAAIVQTTTAQTPPAQAAPAQAAPAQTATVQTTAGQTTAGQTAAGQTAAGQTAAGQTIAEPAPADVKAGPKPAAATSVDPSADPKAQTSSARTADPAADADMAPAADSLSDAENAGTGTDGSGQDGETHGGRQAQQHTDRIGKAAERNAAQPEGANAARPSDPATGIETESRGGASIRTVPGLAGDDGKPAIKERGTEAGPSFEDALAKVKPVHKEPEADGSLGVQAASQGTAEAEATERAAAPHGRSTAQHGAAADQVSVQLGKAVPGKNDQMIINLKPVELGSVEVKLDFGADGRVQASIMAERPETLEMLQKDHRALERALNDAGLQTDAGSLSFNLKGQGQGGNQRQFAGYNQPGGGRGKGLAGMNIEGPAIPDFAAPQYGASGANRSRLDIRI